VKEGDALAEADGRGGGGCRRCAAWRDRVR
jgi:hypothetical protein